MKQKILFTDLDFTLIKPKGNRRFPKDHTDWVPLEDSIKFIKEYMSKGYKLILVTNQGGIGKGYIKEEDITKKLNLIQGSLGITFYKIFMATTMNSDYRKPKVNKMLQDLKKDNIEIDTENSFMLGDAGGRKRDHSNADKRFAENLGIDFIHVDDIDLLIT